MILERISKETGVSVDDLKIIVRTASKRYRRYTVEKRTGGEREISHPAPEVKFLQRWLNRNVFSCLPVHAAVMSYRTGIGVEKNAEIHAPHNYLLKVDFTDFFPSLKAEDVRRVIVANSENIRPELSEEDVADIEKIVCRNKALTIGAPSSPSLSNAILYDLDCFVLSECRKRKIIYSRYADDLFFSTNHANELSVLLDVVRSDLAKRQSPSLTINENKTVFTSRKRRRVVTGLVLTSDGEVSVGREKKRQIRTQVYLYGQGSLGAKEISYLRGYLAYVHSVEPAFLQTLERKFGGELLQRLMAEELVARKY
jgi:hypothetical protein